MEQQNVNLSDIINQIQGNLSRALMGVETLVQNSMVQKEQQIAELQEKLKKFEEMPKEAENP